MGREIKDRKRKRDLVEAESVIKVFSKTAFHFRVKNAWILITSLSFLVFIGSEAGFLHISPIGRWVTFCTFVIGWILMGIEKLRKDSGSNQ